MKKSILNMGKALNKAEQQQINGGFGCIRECRIECGFNNECFADCIVGC